jgi:hypothetical protein
MVEIVGRGKGAELTFNRLGIRLPNSRRSASTDASNGILFSAEVIPTEAAKRP